MFLTGIAAAAFHCCATLIALGKMLIALRVGAVDHFRGGLAAV